MTALVDEVPWDWYAHGFTAATAMLPWTDNVEADVDTALRILEPPPGSRVLDLACGAGRHAVELARRGFSAVGVDIAECVLVVGAGIAELEEAELGRRLDLEYREEDLRDLEFENEFDVVLNLHGGAVGYFENDAENRRTFETIARSLRPGGRALMQLPNVLHAESRLPAKTWTEGRMAIELLDRRWDPADRYVEGSITPIVLDDPDFLHPIPFRQRLYSVEELFELFCSVGMSLEMVLDAAGLQTTLTAEEPEIFVVASRDRR